MQQRGLVWKTVLTGIASLLNDKRGKLCIGVFENGVFREVYQ